MLINLRNAMMTRRLPYKCELEYLGVVDCQSCKIGARKIYSGNTVKADLIPVLDWSGNAKMFDRVTGTYPAHYGTFIAGPEIWPVEFIAGTGDEWIATTTIDDPANNIAQITFNITTSTSSSMNIFGSSDVRFNYVVARWGLNRYNFGPNAATTPVLPISVGDIHVGTYTLTNGELVYTLDGASAIYASSLVYDNLPSRIFKIYGASSAGLSGRVYEFKVIRKSDGAVLADYKAIRVGTGSTWEGAMMDVLTRRIYRNAGTGAFTYGNDLKYPIPSE